MIAAMQLVANEIAHAMLRGQTESLSAQMESEEQQRLAQDLHDGLGQRVSGIAMLAHQLRRSLEQRGSEEAAAAAELSGAIEEAKIELRALVRGVMPVIPTAKGSSRLSTGSPTRARAPRASRARSSTTSPRGSRTAS